MFKFDFEIEELDEETAGLSHCGIEATKTEFKPLKEEAFAEIGLGHLVSCLPPLLSCSPLPVSLSSSRTITIARRDLFDARFQVINEEDNDIAAGKDALNFLDAPSDLVHGVYEGGLKTWECSLDLVEYMEDYLPHGKRILEVGCGTAIPTLFLLGKLFSDDASNHKTEIHLQDYNVSVLELITIPNILLAWYMSPASATFRETTSVLEDPESEMPPADPAVAADIPISDELKSAFLESLKKRSITLRFFSGSWSTFVVESSYDIVLTSETIYRPESMAPLISLLRATHAPCLVAAKVFYFGVGGGINGFIKAVEHADGKSETVWEKTSGVGRNILRVTW